MFASFSRLQPLHCAHETVVLTSNLILILRYSLSVRHDTVSHVTRNSPTIIRRLCSACDELISWKFARCCILPWWVPRSAGHPLRQRQRIFPLAAVSRPALRPIQISIQWVPEVLSRRERATRAWRWPRKTSIRIAGLRTEIWTRTSRIQSMGINHSTTTFDHQLRDKADGAWS
jgi:hypothetical protein